MHTRCKGILNTNKKLSVYFPCLGESALGCFNHRFSKTTSTTNHSHSASAPQCSLCSLCCLRRGKSWHGSGNQILTQSICSVTTAGNSYGTVNYIVYPQTNSMMFKIN